MTYELAYYIFMCMIGMTFCMLKIKSEKTYFILTFLLLLLYSYVTRYSGFDGDMNVYATALKSNQFSLYYLKEPVYWIVSRYLYSITQSPEYTFMIYDAVSFIFVLKASKNMKLPQYFPFLFLLFFPAVMGINNVYRQYLSYSFFLYFMSLFFIDSGLAKKSFYLLISMLTHNVAALFAPFMFTVNKNRFSLKALLSYLGVLALLPLVIGFKSNTSTGDLGIEVYILVILCFILFYVFSYRMKFEVIPAKFLYFFIYMFSLTSLASILMGLGQSKRVGMYVLMISLVPIIMAAEKNYKHKALIRVILYILLIIPTFVFSSSLNMLLTAT